MTVGTDTIRVLCVDDDPAFADVTARMLELRAESIAATAVDSAAAGLEELEAGTYDCVVSDYDMPDRDGLAFLSAIRERGLDVPFVLFTGKGSEEIAGEAIRAGAADYIQKGAGRERYDLLTRRVQNAAERARERRQRRVAERRYQQLFEQRVVGIGMSQGGVFREVNERFAELFGYDRSSVIDTPVRELIAPEDRDRVARALRRRESGEVDTLHYVVTGVRADGEHVDVEVHGGRVEYGGEPAVLGIVVPVAAVDDEERPTRDETTEVVADLRAARHALGDGDHDDALAHLEDALATVTDVSGDDGESTVTDVSGDDGESTVTPASVDAREDAGDDGADGSTGTDTTTPADGSDGADGGAPVRGAGQSGSDDTSRRVAVGSPSDLSASWASLPTGEVTPTVAERAAGGPDGGAPSTLAAAVAVARERLDAAGCESVDVVGDGDATYDVECSVLGDTVARLAEAGLGDEPSGGRVTVAPTPDGLRVRVSTPELASRLDDDLVEGVGSRPPPVAEIARRRYWAVYSTSVADDTVEYELEGPNRVDGSEGSSESEVSDE
ncbi:response regulator [Halobaculum sp. MBLA0147]|uniref:response regulator n=1 Tax=Halobaculum sp. MBLA0147 TaxID=3079934 RepID=UPI003524987E